MSDEKPSVQVAILPHDWKFLNKVAGRFQVEYQDPVKESILSDALTLQYALTRGLTLEELMSELRMMLPAVREALGLPAEN